MYKCSIFYPTVQIPYILFIHLSKDVELYSFYFLDYYQHCHCEHMLSLSLGKYLRIKLLDYTYIFKFLRNFETIFQSREGCHLLSNNMWEF